MLTSPIALTNTHSVGVVRDALIAYEAERHAAAEDFWSLPVVAETYDWLAQRHQRHARHARSTSGPRSRPPRRAQWPKGASAAAPA